MTSYSELHERLQGLRPGPIAVIGDLMADRFIYGDAERLSPEAPVPVVRITRLETMPGGAANVGRNIIGLGGEMALFGVLGEDHAADEVEEHLALHGADLNGVVRLPGRPTTVKTRIVARSQHMLRYDYEQVDDVGDEPVEELVRRLAKVVDRLRLVVFSDYAKGLVTPLLVSRVAALCRDFSVPIVVDTKPAHVGLFHGADVFKPNLSEALRLIGIEQKPQTGEMEAVCRSVLEVARPKNLVVTAGGDGMYVLAAGRFTHIEGFHREVYDVAGAGDTTLAAIAVGMAGGLGLLDSALLGNFAGSIAVGKLGTALVTIDELHHELRVVADGAA